MTKETSTSGIGFFGLLAILFIGLKLTGFIDWSWWWVLAPIWAPIVIIIAILLIAIAVGIVIQGSTNRRRRIARELEEDND